MHMQWDNPQGSVQRDAANAWLQFVPLILIIIVFYFFLLRPQYKKQKEQEKMINALKKGDEVIIQGVFLGLFKM